MKGTIFWRFFCFFIEENIVILWDEMGGSGRIWDPLQREKGDFERQTWWFHACKLKVPPTNMEISQVMMPILMACVFPLPWLWYCCDIVLWDGGPGWPAQYPQPTGATRGQGWTIEMDSSGRFVTTACAGTCWACLKCFVLNFVRSL